MPLTLQNVQDATAHKIVQMLYFLFADGEPEGELTKASDHYSSYRFFIKSRGYDQAVEDALVGWPEPHNDEDVEMVVNAVEPVVVNLLFWVFTNGDSDEILTPDILRYKMFKRFIWQNGWHLAMREVLINYSP